ncbi:nucleotidyltransferase family protein [Methyloterricola oryzae]|uniref:nucleotidyltransferase family protein n=1 Tax=Methyloterricola oryzae TaxID=1495050 RepID=UPI0009E1BAB0
MRLSREVTCMILEIARRQFGDAISVWLFGSRVDDMRRGGDIDLLVEVRNPVDNKPVEAARFAAALQWQLGDQKIDVIIDDGRNHQLVHEIARREGILLRC